MIRSTIALLLTDAAHACWRGAHRFTIAIDRVAVPIAHWMLATAARIDADTEPCRECGAPGGTHVDCDMPLAGRMTRTERLTYFGSDA